MKEAKKILGFLFALFISHLALSQTYLDGEKYRIGLKAGPSVSLMTGTAFTTPKPGYGFTGGLYYKQKVDNGFHLQTEITPSIRNTNFSNTSDTGYTKISLFFIDFAQYIVKDIQKDNHTHCVLAGLQPSVLVQSWLYNNYYQLSPAARDIKLNTMALFFVVGYQYNKKIIGIQSVIKVGLTNINRGLNMYDAGGNHLGPTNDLGTIRNISWETTLSF